MSDYWTNNSIKRLDEVLQNLGDELDSIMVSLRGAVVGSVSVPTTDIELVSMHGVVDFDLSLGGEETALTLFFDGEFKIGGDTLGFETGGTALFVMNTDGLAAHLDRN